MTRARRGSRPVLQALLALMAAPVLVALRLEDLASNTVDWPIPELPEPSGIVYHPLRKSLFVVGDEGDIAEVSLDGKLLRQFHFGGDLEAITVDPRNGLLYVAREGHEIIFEVRPDTFELLRRFTIDRSWQGDPDFLRRGGDGVEGLTFVPDETNPEGGVFWAVNQYDPPVLVELAIPLRSSKDKSLVASIARAIPVDSAPLSEVTWEAASREFLIVSALWKRVSVLDADGNFERSVHIPGFMPEGLTRLPDGSFVLAQDSGGLVLWKPGRDPFQGDATIGPPPPDAPKKRAVPAPAARPVAMERRTTAPVAGHAAADPR